VLRVIEDGGSVTRVEATTVNGEPCVVVDVTGKAHWPEDMYRCSFSYGLLPKYQYAVKHREQRSLDGKLLQSVENADLVKVPGTGAYLPKKSTVRYYTWIFHARDVNEQPLLEETFVVTSVDTRPIERREFSLRDAYRSPGTGIRDYTTAGPEGESTFYIIPANPEDLDRVIEAASGGRAYAPLSRARRAAAFLLVGLVPAALVLAILWVRRRRCTPGR
jgi:hypothetical protein